MINMPTCDMCGCEIKTATAKKTEKGVICYDCAKKNGLLEDKDILCYYPQGTLYIIKEPIYSDPTARYMAIQGCKGELQMDLMTNKIKPPYLIAHVGGILTELREMWSFPYSNKKIFILLPLQKNGEYPNESLIDEYNKAAQNVLDLCGLDTFEIDIENHLNDKFVSYGYPDNLMNLAENSYFRYTAPSPSYYRSSDSGSSSQGFSCPYCGARNSTPVTENSTYGKNYSLSSGLCGYWLLGPLGLLCGLTDGKKTTSETYWMCNNCGRKFTR